MITALSLGLVMGACVCAALTAVAVPLLDRAQVMSTEDEGVAHRGPLPTGGGVAVVLATALVMGVGPAALWSLEGLEQITSRFEVMLLGTAVIVAFAILGLARDLRLLGTATCWFLRLGLGLGLGLGLAWVYAAPPALALPVALGSAVIVSASTAMDRVRGLAAGHAAVCALWYVLVAITHPVPGLGLTMVALGGACLGFLPFNAPSTCVLLGRSGTYALGGAWVFAATTCLIHAVPAQIALAPLLIPVVALASLLLIAPSARTTGTPPDDEQWGPGPGALSTQTAGAATQPLVS